ncbi:tannase/feruloyl esterase family alpha/beta hydrolase [Lampropedia cohaerens]|uniref:tannase/feruloyl esterase family alpha/beta hydrolase n=1 Tax=Lampropedia cohaerens TaxID=1610491 RepID=UPI0006996180|nr:tannase/feruloyl esterase family alpha/beta hydrolase [Lampropedia cohaerens]
MDLMDYSLTADVDTEYAKLFATQTPFTRSGVEFTNGDSENLDAFRQRGGKLIIFHGAADLAFSIHDVAAYYDRLRARYGDAQTADTARAFFVPGMAHCAGGNATDQFDAVGAVIGWVEAGRAPDVLIATAGAGTDWPGRTRPLCPYPQEAVYKGSGSLEDAENFACR